MPQSDLGVALHSRPFQLAGARFAMRHKNVLIADEPGLGKTIQAIAAVTGNKTTGSVLIVAPKTAAYVTWPAELRRWLHDLAPDDPVRIITGNADKRTRIALLRDTVKWETSSQRAGQRQWVIVSPNYLRFKIECDDKGRYVHDDKGNKIITPVREALKPLLYIQWAAVIVDEAHETLAGATGNLKKQSAQSRGLRLLDIRDDGMRIALSGTPFRGKHENIWGILNWIDPVEYNANGGPNSYWKWVYRYFQVYHDDVFDTDVIGKLRSERDLRAALKPYMIRRTKKKVLPELPDKQYGGTPLYPKKKPPKELLDAVARAAEEQKANPKARLGYRKAQSKLAGWYDKNNPVAVWLPMDGKQRTAYNQMKTQAMANIEGGTLLANSLLAEMTRLKQFANSYGRLDEQGNYHPDMPSNKFDWILQFLNERGIYGPEPSGNRIIIASQFTKHINLFAQVLLEQYKIPNYKITGATSADERLRIQEEFQSGQTPAGKPSPEVLLLNTKAGGVGITLDAADDMIVVDSTHNVDDQVQLEDRIHRISRIHSVTIWNLVTKGTIDEKILRATRKTGRSLKRILDTPEAAKDLLES
ncbi:DNA helicase [Mycobacterium phage Weiss13]|uniref:DNA helicase n=2 Tax=Papyrusvirus send513 TaxID=1982556 RepID=A0A120HUK2_9CAUD|nr:DNA helicase [Mycobacterium phage Weiss13]ARW57153.1 DNA helicase [Mycobacterium phage Zenon]